MTRGHSRPTPDAVWAFIRDRLGVPPAPPELDNRDLEDVPTEPDGEAWRNYFDRK
jgi:hypothetical protein